MLEHSGLNHHEVPSAYYLGIRLGEVCTCDLKFLRAFRISWPELEMLLTPLEDNTSQGTP